MNSLTQTLLKCTAPGVPDTYQGSEIWDLRLVDPDNRGPIDYESRQAMLAELEAGMSVEEIMNRMDSGMPKLWVLYKALHLRREKPEWFGREAAYIPLPRGGAEAGASDRIFPWRFGCGPRSAMEYQARQRVWFYDRRVAAGKLEQRFYRGNSEWWKHSRATIVSEISGSAAGARRRDGCISLECGLHLRSTCRSNPAALSYAMQGPDDRDWWSCQVEDAGPGTDYGYLLDDDPRRYPDPRSEWQPNGVHGLSRIYDQAAFEWSDARFQAPPLASAIVYELHIGTFTPEGTLDAAAGKLAYLAELGMTHVELMPVNAFEGDHGWGYDGVALFAVHRALWRPGRPEAICECGASGGTCRAARCGVQPLWAERQLHWKIRAVHCSVASDAMGRRSES